MRYRAFLCASMLLAFLSVRWICFVASAVTTQPLTVRPHSSLRDTLAIVAAEAPTPPEDGPEDANPPPDAIGCPASTSILVWNINMAIGATLEPLGVELSKHQVVGLVEVPWKPAAFVQQAKAWGFDYALLLRTDRAHRFNIGLLSKTPLRRTTEAHGSTFFHGLLCGALPLMGDLTVCVTHLTPHAPSARLQEAQALRRLLSGHAQRPLLLLGDLNTLSPADAAAHRASGLAARLAESRTLRKFSDGTALDYSAFEALTSSEASEGLGHASDAASALTDLHHHTVATSGAYTVPTSRGGDPRHAAPMRLDYALSNRALLEQCGRAGAFSRIITTEEVGALSDHYPVHVRICLGGGGGRGAGAKAAGSGSGCHPPAGLQAEATASKATASKATASTRLAAPGSSMGSRAGAAEESIRPDPSASSCAEERAAYSGLLAPRAMAECAAMSGLRAAAAATHHAAVGRKTDDGASVAPTLGRCAVVGSSGSLLAGPALGEEIDAHDTVLRLNAAPIAGYEARVGHRTNVRFVNAPQSSEWARELRRQASEGRSPVAPPDAVAPGELLFLSASLPAWSPLTDSRTVAAALINRTYRKRCVLPFFDAADLAAHSASHGNALTPTFGFESVVHALHACRSVDVYGFHVPASALEPNEAAALASAERRLHLPSEDGRPGPDANGWRYHYWQERFVDKAAATPSKPWTFKSHNYPIESARLRHLACAGVIKLHKP